MTLTDEEAREIIDVLSEEECDSPTCGLVDSLCLTCKDTGLLNHHWISLLESRIGVEDELTAAYMAGFEKGRDAGRKERG